MPEDAVIVALVARVDPMKDHATFLEAAQQVAKVRGNVHFFLVGKDTETLAPAVAAKGLTDRVRILGYRSAIECLLPGVDVLCLSSAFGEGSPNVLGEAMACGVPCVSTDVGDARSIIGNTGLVVPVRDPASLAHAIIDLIDRGPAAREHLGRAARARIETEYSLTRIVDRYTALYSDLSFNDPSAR
jgi:glycosyltransferase involved in cell wall biosynthesis